MYNTLLEYLDLVEVTKNQILSESFIRENQSIVEWDCVSECQTLSEEFIREFNID